MKKWSKFILAILLVAVLASAFTACKLKEEELSLTFVSDEKQYATTIGIDDAKNILDSQPSRDGFVFKGWYRDKGTWTQKVDVDNIEEISKNNKTIEVYAYWIEIVNKITVSFHDYMGGILLEKDYERSDDELAKDLASLRPSKRADDEKYTYTFDKWLCDTSDMTIQYFIATPEYKRELRQFNFNYFVDGELVYTDKVRYGENADRDLLANPQKASTEQYDYIFTGWNGNFDNITQDTDVYAVFEQKIKTFDVTFNYGNNKSKPVKVEYGKNATPPSESELAKSSTAQYSYIFVGWDNSFENIKGNTLVNAKYVEQVRTYDVNFWIDDQCIKSVNAPYGSSVEAPSQPVKPADDGFTYEFAGWDKDFSNIVADTRVNAIFNKIAHTYTVQYVNWDGTLLDTQQVESGQKSEYGGEIPTREENDKYTYEFIGWSDQDALDSVTHSFAVKAQFKEVIRTYTVTFNYGNGYTKVLADVPYGTDLTDSAEIPTNTDTAKDSTKQYDFTFIDWDKYFGYVSRDMEINAIYKETIRRYIVKFINNGLTILTQEVEYGKCPILPTTLTILNNTAKWAFDYLGWQVLDVDTTLAGGENDIDPDDGTDYRYTVADAEGYEVLDPKNSKVEGDITYTAIYLRTIRQYIVKFFNEENDQNVLSEITVPWGTNVINLAPEASKESTPKFEYTFLNWSKDLTKIEDNISVYAQFLANIRSYWIRYYNEGELVEEFYAEYDSVIPRTDVIPAKISTLEFDFEFEDWDKKADRLVDGDIDVNALYKNNLRSYVVTLFNLATRALVSTGEFAYGTKITTKIDYNGYDFDHWYRDPDCNTVFDQENETVDGPMMLFGNIVMKGLKFDGDNAIIGYDGVEDAQVNLILPMAANGKKVTTVKEKGLSTDSVTPNSIGSIYIPSTITKVEAYAFSGLVLTDTGGIYVQSPKKWYGTPTGWNQYWNRNSLTSWHEGDRPDTYGVDGVYSVGDFQYMLFEDGYAYVDRFINNTASNAYIPANLTYKASSFDVTKWKDVGKTEVERDIYTIAYEDKHYDVKQIAVSAFENCANVTSIYIPTTIEKIGKYAFSGVTADVYIQREKPVAGEVPSGWDLDWNTNRDAKFLGGDGTGKRELYWGVVGFDVVGEFNYIFKANGTAIVAEYLGSKATKMSLEVSGVVTYKGVEYQVVELADELLADMTALKTVTLGENIKKIGKKVFANNSLIFTPLSEVNLPSTLEEIGEQAFSGNASLKQIYIPANVSKIGSYAFIGIDDLTIYLGKEKAPLTGYSLGWDTKISLSDLKDLDLSNIIGSIGTALGKITQKHDKVWGVAGLPQTQSVGTVLPSKYTYLLYNDGHAELISSEISPGSLNTSYTIPSSITYNDREFTVTTIKTTAFKGNARIKELIIPTSVTTIEANAFQGCDNLTIKTAYTEAERPSGWDNNFNPDNRTVEWATV